jgi:uncharacterized protein YaeQ
VNATVCRVDLNVADMDRHYYADHALTVARHASETDERMMVRVLAFALHARERLAFGRGIGSTDEPDVWLSDLTGRTELWIDVGLPDERRVRKACSLSQQVVIYAYGGRGVDVWWARVGRDLRRFQNLDVVALGAATTQALAGMAERSMSLQLTVQDGEAWFAGGDERVTLERTWLAGTPHASLPGGPRV